MVAVATVMVILIIVQWAIIYWLVRMIEQARQDRMDALKWAARREIMRKFYKENGR